VYHQGCLNAFLLQSLYLEACGDNAKLLEFHKQILEDDENNEAILKRQVRPRVAMLRAGADYADMLSQNICCICLIVIRHACV